MTIEDAEFCAHAREDVPALVAEVRRLKAELTEMEARKDAAYEERDRVVALSFALARRLGMWCGTRPHEGEDWGPRWRTVVVLELPTGQVSWHVPSERQRLFAAFGPHGVPWDGHDSPTKYARIEAYVQSGRDHVVAGESTKKCEKRKVLFLDVDGVLNSQAYLQKTPEACTHADSTLMLDPEACARLVRVLEATGAAVVIASSWRYGYTPAQMTAMLAQRGVVADVIDETPKLGIPRGREIQAWLDAHPEVTTYAIVDDGGDLGPLDARLVRTSWEAGLQDEHVPQLCALLGEGTP